MKVAIDISEECVFTKFEYEHIDLSNKNQVELTSCVKQAGL